MFAKLLKQEWQGCRQVLGIFCAIILGSGLTIGLSSVYMVFMAGQQIGISDTLWNILVIILFIASMIIIGVGSLGGLLYLIWRFYQSRFTDEGYLTFTLPVNHHQLLLAPIVNIIRGSLLVCLSTIGAFLLAGLVYCIAFFPGDMDWSELFRMVSDFLPKLYEGINWSGCLNALLYILSRLLSGLMLLLFSVTTGAILARKHPLLMAAAVYYGISITQTIGLFFFGLGSNRLGLWGYGLPMNLVTIVAGYWLIYWLQSRKLNLT